MSLPHVDQDLQAELATAYARLDTVTDTASALYVGLYALVEALLPLPDLPGLTPANKEHLRIVLQEARQALNSTADDPARGGWDG